MANTYSLQNLSVILSTPLKYDLTRTLSEIKKAFKLADHQAKNIGFIEYSYIPRKRFRITYLKSRFKHRKAIRHYVFEQYNYNITVFNPFDIDIVISSILGSLSPSVHARCIFSWNYPCINQLEGYNKLNNFKTENIIINRILSKINK